MRKKKYCMITINGGITKLWGEQMRSIREQFGNDVVFIGGVITRTSSSLFTIREINGKLTRKTEYDIKYSPSLRDICKELGIPWYDKEKFKSKWRKNGKTN